MKIINLNKYKKGAKKRGYFLQCISFVDEFTHSKILDL